MNHVLYIGPDYRNHRGGIGAVIAVYAAHLKPFKFIPTYTYGSFAGKTRAYLSAIVTLIWKLLTDRTIKIVHIHTASRGSFTRKSLLVLISKLMRKKVVLHIHGAEFHIFYNNYRWMRSYIRFILHRCDAIVCLSEKWSEFFSTHFRPKQLAIINNVIEIPSKPEIRAPRNGQVHFLFLGAIGHRKGIFDLMQVLQQNKTQFEDRYVLTVGGNGEVDRLKQEIAAHHPGGEVKYAGWVSGDKKNSLLQACDVYVLPSYNEGLPISVLEAIAHGKPVISTRVGGIPEIVKPGYNGWLLDPGDHDALKTVLEEVFADKNRLEEYGRNSFLLSRNYAPGPVFHSLDLLYKKLMHE